MKSHSEIPKNIVLSAENLHGEIRTKSPNKIYCFLHMLTLMLKQQKKISGGFRKKIGYPKENPAGCEKKLK
jgi:predicted RNase H-like nuclease